MEQLGQRNTRLEDDQFQGLWDEEQANRYSFLGRTSLDALERDDLYNIVTAAPEAKQEIARAAAAAGNYELSMLLSRVMPSSFPPFPADGEA